MSLVKTMSNWSRVGSKSNMTGVPIRRGETQRARRRCHVETEAEVGTMQGQERNVKIAGRPFSPSEMAHTLSVEFVSL